MKYWAKTSDHHNFKYSPVVMYENCIEVHEDFDTPTDAVKWFHDHELLVFDCDSDGEDEFITAVHDENMVYTYFRVNHEYGWQWSFDERYLYNHFYLTIIQYDDMTDTERATMPKDRDWLSLSEVSTRNWPPIQTA